MTEKPSSACHVCGNTVFIWGHARSLGGREITFNEDQGDIKGDFFSFNDRKTRARLCSSCGNLQIFVVNEA